jgi:hypothetical protein
MFVPRKDKGTVRVAARNESDEPAVDVELEGNSEPSHLPEKRSGRNQRVRKTPGAEKIFSVAWAKNHAGFIFAGVGLVIVILLISNPSSREEKPSQLDVAVTTTASIAPTATPSRTKEQQLQDELAAEGFGVQTPLQDSQTQNLTPVESDTFVKDIRGQDIPELFEISGITYITDLVVYKKHRAITGDGIELYWLEGEYQGQPCRLTIPFKYFKELATEGAVYCTIEVVKTRGGGIIFSYFQFDPEMYEKMTKRR